jgi:hypothetical protein
MLFRPGPNLNLNACVGTNGGPYDFGAYGEGFFTAGFEIIAAITKGAWTIDILIYPAVFDFRHGIELYLKHFTILANRLLGSDETMKKGHGITKNWEELKELFVRIDNPFFDPTEIGVVEDILNDIVMIDATGQVFRYPEDNKGQPHLEDIAIINAEVLQDGMRVLADIFENWDSGFVGLLEQRKLNTASV